MIREAVQALVEGQVLPAAVMQGAMEDILSGTADPALIGALVVGLRMRGESPDEIAAAARVLRRRCVHLDVDSYSPLLDTCGTGGDASGTFNISTTAAIVVAAAGVHVAKHGNRAVSSRAGSADVLEALGVRIDVPLELSARALREVGICFLFAPAHHAAMRHAAPARQALGIRTLFNLLGPLSNPAGATHQLLGVYAADRVVVLARVLAILGTDGAWVIHGAGGLDEVSPCGVTEVAEVREGSVREFRVQPADFGVTAVAVSALAGGDAASNAALTREILSGRGGDARAAVLVNAAAGLYVCGRGETLRDATRLAAQAIDSGCALGLLDRWCALTSG